MKKFDTFQTFARGAKSLVAILLVMLMAVGSLFAQTTYNHVFPKANPWSQTQTTAELSGIEWTAVSTSTYFSNGSDQYDAKGIQFGSGNKPASSLTISTEEISGTITSITVNTSGANSINATFKVKVGDTYFMSGDANTITLTNTATDYTFTGSASGEISLEWTQTSSKAIYIKSITVVYESTTPTVEIPTWVTEDQVAIFNTQVNGLVPTFSVNDNNESVFHFAYTDAFQGYPAQNPSTEMGANPSKVYVDMMIKRPNADITGVKVSYGPGHEEIIDFTDVTDPYNGTLGNPYYAVLSYFPVATVFTDGTVVGNPVDKSWTVDVEWCIGTEVVDTQYVIVKVDAAPGDNWVACEKVGVFNTQVDGLVPTCSTVGDSTVFHFAYTDAFNGFPEQTPNQEMGGNPAKVYVDVRISRPNDDITGVKVSYGPGHEEIINFTEVTDPNNGTLGHPYDAVLAYFPVATVNADGSVTGNTVDRNWTIDVEWCVNQSVVCIQKLNVMVDAAPLAPAVDTWVSCEQVDVFNTQVTGLVPTCATVGDSTVFHFAYNEDFEGFPAQTPNQEMGGNPSKVYVDVMIKRPNENITGVKVSYGPGHEEILNFTEVTDPNNGTLGHPYDAILYYFPVATVNADGSVTGNTVDRNWTVDVEWCVGTEVVATQYLNVMVDAAPAPVLPYDTVAELPYVNNFDEGIDPYFVIENGENTNKWYINQAQTFDNNKLYISSNGGTTNKYDITKASTVTAYRDVMIPETGAVLSFDYRVNGEAGVDYMLAELIFNDEITEIGTYYGDNEWKSVNYSISGEMAGVVRVQFTWNNNNSQGNQFPAAIDNISIIETPCSQPTALTANVDSTTAVITWEAVEGQTAWNFEYKLADHSEWYTIAATDTFVTLTDLQGNSNYEMRVQAVCGENVSAWTTGAFAVACQNGNISVVVEDVEIGTNGTTNAYLPFYGLYNYAYSQQIIDAEEINTTAGNIYSVSFNCSSAPASTSTGNIKIWMANTTKSVFDNNTDYIDPSTLTLVYEGPSSYAYQTGWNTFTFDTPFEYTGGNVVVAYYEGNGSYNSGSFYVHSTSTNKSISHYNDTQSKVSYTDPATATGTKYFSTYRNHMKLNMDVTVGSCDDVVACPNPSNLEVSDITPNSAVLTWTAGAEGQTEFLLEYMAEGDADWTSVIVNDTTYTLNDLAQLTNYSVKVKAICDTNNWSDIITADFRTIGICPPVTNLETSNVSNTTTLTWTAGGEESAWLVQFKPASENEDAWTSINVNLIPMTTFGGLVGNTDYNVRVKALCDPEDEENQSEWTSTTFHSGCAAVDLPFSQLFNENDMPTCWENEGFGFNTSNGAYSNTNGAELISPAINIPAENPTYLTFEVRGIGDYTVLASYRGTRADRFAEIYSGVAPQYRETVIIPLADLYKGRAVNFKIVNNSSNNYQYFYSVNVNQCPFVATALTTSNITGTALDFAWESDATIFQVQYGEQGFTAGEGTSIDVTDTTAITVSGLNYGTAYDFYVRVVCEGDNGKWVGPVTATTAPACSQPNNVSAEALTASSYYISWSASTWTVGDNTQYVVGYKAAGEEEYTETEPTEALFATISNLLSNTTYTVAVRAICSEDYSSTWGNTVSFTTPCDALSLPYTEDFESYAATSSTSTVSGGVMPDCWTSIWNATPSSSYNYCPKITSTTSYNPNGSGKFLFFMASTSTTSYMANNPTTVILPAFDVDLTTAMISFKVRGSNTSDVELNLGYVNNNNVFTALAPVTFGTTTGADLQTIVLNNYTIPTGVKLAFQANVTASSSATKYFGLDDIMVELIPNCFVPDVAISGTTATITPNVNGAEPQSYDVQIGDMVQNVTTNTVDLYTLFGLELEASYQVRVRAICSETDASDWTDWTNFTTPPCEGGASLNLVGTSTTSYLPTYTYYNYSYTQQIYTKEEIGAANGGMIESFSIRVAGSTSATRNITVYMINTDATNFATTTSWLSVTSNDIVFSGTVAFTAGNWKEINLTTPFMYDGTKNLALIVDDNTGSYVSSPSFGVHSTSNNKALRIYSDGVNYDPYNAGSYTGTLMSVRNDIKFNVCPPPTCGTPNISVNGTTATITPSSIGTPASYDLQIGEEIVNISSDSTTVDLMDWFTLESATNYEVSVRANCGEGDYSAWSNAVSFITPCETTCTYTLSLVDSYGDGWSGNAINVMMNGTVIATMTISSGAEYTGTVSACGEVSFAWVVGSYPGETSFTIEDESGNTLYTCTNGSSLTNGQVFYSTTCDGAVVTCHVPEQLNVSEISETSAVVTWTDNHDQDNYALEYRADNENGWNVVTVDTNYYLLSNLIASTEYLVRVKAVCGTDDESEYTNEVAFRTNCIGGGNVEIAGDGNNQNYIPVGTYYNYSYTQQILTAEEIGAVGTISGISFEYAYTTAMSLKNNVKIYMANTDKSEFASTSDWIAVSDMQLVYQGNLNCSEGWNEFALNNTFAYAGNNLAILVEDNSGAYDGSAFVFATTNTSENRSLTWQADGAAYAGQAGTLRKLHSNIRLTVCPEATDLAITNINTIADACEVEGAVTITVKNVGYEPVSAFTAYYQVNEETPVHEDVTVALAQGETAEYTFSTLPVFATGANTLTAWVVLEGDAVEANNSIIADPITTLDPIAVPYVEAFTGLTINHGWNPIDANNDGITMNLNDNINYTYNDTKAADDWMMSPCIELTPGTYTVSYDYMANSAMTESFEVYYGNGAHIADMTNALAAHTFNNTTVETVTHTITISEEEAGIYNFGFHATSLAGNMGFSIDNFKVYPVNDVLVTFDTNGTVTPNGTIAVNYGEDLTLNLVPDPMYHVAGVWVDDVQVVPEDGTGANFMLYTLENITEPHTVFVDFKLEFHIIKSVENFRSDLYADFGGAFEPAATDTTIDPSAFTVKMVADPHYFLNSLSWSPMTPNDMQDVTAAVVDNGDGTYNYTIDTLVVANYYLNAVFRRDTVDINYNVLTGKGYANDSQLLDATDADNNSYTTWVDYSVYNDVDTTVTFAAGDNYHIVDVIVNGESQGRIDSYTFEDVTESQNVDIKFGYRIDAFVSNYNTYDSITDIMGTITPDTQYVAEYDPMMVVGTVEEHFHLYQFFVNGEDRISEVVFGSDPHYYYFTMDSIADNYTIEAVVKVDTFAITYNVLAGQGYADASGLLVEGDSYSTIVNYADNWYSNIEPATGYSIANVTLDGTNLYTANNYQFNYIEESHVFDVTFVANTYTVATNAYGNGTVSDGITFTYDPENAVDYEFTATPAEGYYIASVTINNEAMEITDVDNFTYTIENVADNYTINVIFQMYTYTMTATVNPTSTLEGDVYGGTITPSGTQTVNYGADVTYTINANEGWYIYYVTVDGVNTNYTQADGLNTLDVPFTNINDNHEVEVGFLRYKYDITAAIDGEVHGAINEFFTSLTEVVYYGENFSMTFDADNNYQVADVVIDGEDMGAITSYEFVNVTANHTVVVSFEAIMYTLTATSNTEGCTITPATTTVQAGSNVNYTLTVANGYHLENVIANGEEVVVTNNAFTISDVQSDYTIFANFASNYVTVTVDQPAHATITPGTQTFAYGATPSYMIVPEVGYDVVSVTAGNAIVPVTYNNGIGSFTLDPVHGNITLTATTEIKKFEITVTQGENGTITPGTQSNVEYGSSRTFNITPSNDYYVIVDVIVDGSSRGALSSYTFYNVTSNHTITAVFEANCQNPTNLTAMDIDTTSAVLSWVGTAPSYEVRYRAFDSGIYTPQTVTTTTLHLNGLTPNTMYEYGVRSVCGAGMTSDWVTNVFTTRALPVEPVGIADANMSSIKVYSYQNNVYVVNEEGIAINSVDIYDIYGKQVYTGKVLSSPEVISLNVANGNYVVRLATENGVGVYKVVIVR